MTDVRIVKAGDAAVTVEFEARIDAAVNARAIALADALQAAAIPGLRDIVPTYRTVTIYFEPLRLNYRALLARLETELRAPAPASVPPNSPLRVPVCYGGDLGPDLDDVAAFGRMAPRQAVELHLATPYRVFMLGFLPGFAFMGLVDERIAAPRRTTPRVRVPRGSVGIARRQTGIYPMESPGGWRLIGRTPLRLFDLHRQDPFLMKAGDTVQFYEIDRAEFDRLHEEA